jgi:hypothetical protein
VVHHAVLEREGTHTLALRKGLVDVAKVVVGAVSPRAADSSGLGCGNRDDRERCHRAYWTCGALK